MFFSSRAGHLHVLNTVASVHWRELSFVWDWECNDIRQSYTSFVKSVDLVARSLLQEDSPCSRDHRTEPPQSYPGNEM